MKRSGAAQENRKQASMGLASSKNSIEQPINPNELNVLTSFSVKNL
jgi:hypothetical protein